MPFLKLLNWQGMAGIAAVLALSIMLLVQKGETHHWKKQSAGFEQLYRQEQAAFATTVDNYRTAAVQARAADQANVARVTTEQASINERTSHDFETRLAAAHAAADQRVRNIAEAAAHPGAGGNAPMPGLSAAAGRPAQAAGQNGLSVDDQLTATDQAIQLDELIKWTTAQHAVDPNQAPKP